MGKGKSMKPIENDKNRMTISFSCENTNHILLLATLFDILTVANVDDSIAMIENTGWLVDEIGARLLEVDQFDIGDEQHRLKGNSLEVAKIYYPKLKLTK